MGQYCSNPYINAVISSYHHKFQGLGVEFQLDIPAGDEQLPNMELCQILPDGLENVGGALAKLLQGLHVEKSELPATSREGAITDSV